MHRTLIHIFLDPDIYRYIIVFFFRIFAGRQIGKQQGKRFAALNFRLLADGGGNGVIFQHLPGGG